MIDRYFVTYGSSYTKNNSQRLAAMLAISKNLRLNLFAIILGISSFVFHPDYCSVFKDGKRFR